MRRAFATRPVAAEAANLLGSVLIQKGGLADGERSLRQAIAIDPALAEGHYYLANLLAREEKYPESAYHFVRGCVLRISAGIANRIPWFILSRALIDLPP